ncbi:hypothetical protein [Marinobacterium stanieri]|uniref:hypothetical protein n=1 Tax=Marinobacterium stanieri TaxID=49186 RepID=UPI00030D9B17|nr:hypothetical protein [Marinobacterium stanieri]
MTPSLAPTVDQQYRRHARQLGASLEKGLSISHVQAMPGLAPTVHGRGGLV